MTIKIRACDEHSRALLFYITNCFTIYIVVISVSIQRVFVLLPDKTETAYNKLFITLKKIKPMLDPE